MGTWNNIKMGIKTNVLGWWRQIRLAVGMGMCRVLVKTVMNLTVM
jgi:hypothetical protein